MTRKIIPYAIVVLFAYIGFSFPLPILPEMFLDPHYSILPGYSQKERMILLGLMMASFPFGQFFGSPILGRLSDLYGRKKMILYSLAGTTLGYLITAFSVSVQNVWGMFFGMALCGFCEGNVTIGQSVIVDISDKPEHKARHFGILNAFVSLGFIIGPLMGGQLANPNVVSWFNFATPFWAAALMTLIGMAVIYFGSVETLKNKTQGAWNFFSSTWKGFKRPQLPKLYTANFFLALGYFSFFRFLPVFLEQRFDFNPSYLSFVMVYGSIAMVVTVLTLAPLLTRRFSSMRILATFSILFALAVILCISPTTPYALIITIPLVGICLAVNITHGSLLISNASSLAFQGQALGTLTSVQVLAEALTGFLGGMVASELETLPLYLGSVMSLLCGMLLFTKRKHEDKNV